MSYVIQASWSPRMSKKFLRVQLRGLATPQVFLVDEVRKATAFGEQAEAWTVINRYQLRQTYQNLKVMPL